MHGTEHGSLKCRTLRLSTPRSPFSPVIGSMPQSAPQRSSNRSRKLVTAFRSPATAADFSASIPGSTFPACSFASLPADSAARSALSLRCLARFAPDKAASSRRARCRFLDRHGWPRFLPPLPVGTFTSLRIKAFCRICCLPARLPIPPDLPSLPTAAFYR